MKRTALVLILGLLAVANCHDAAPMNNGLRDEDGRHIIPRGFVVVTSTGGHDLMFDAGDYHRMVRLGANFQVIRLELKKLSRYDGCEVDAGYLEKLDTLVRLGRDAGITTVFKMTNYGIRNWSWEGFWANQNREHDLYLDAWKVVWERYSEEPAVYGYDLLNEPRKLSMDITYDLLVKEHLIPLYHRLIDAHNEINAAKFCLVQSIFQNKGHKTDGVQYTEIRYPIDRPNVVFAPHIYQRNMDQITPELERYEREGALLEAPVFIGEWGYPTYFDGTDNSLSGEIGQLKFIEFYTHTAQEMDRLGMGAIKAWFLGSKTFQDFLPEGPSTWAIFTDKELNGTAERKYITDIIARPYPQVIAGDIKSFLFDHATRTLRLSIEPDNSKGASRIFVGANRHYPDGFTIRTGDGLALALNPLKATGLEVLRSGAESNPSDFIWDESRQQLVILKWPVDQTDLDVSISPGIN